MKKTPAVLEKTITEIAGSEVVPLVKALHSTRVISEQKLAKRVNQEVNQTRTMLYRLHQANLVSFVKKRDTSKGWYVYYWSLRKERLTQLILDNARAAQQHLARPIEKARQFYSCSVGCTNVVLEEAMEMEFRCPECGELMGTDQSGRTVIELEREAPSRRRMAAQVSPRFR